ncbi:hypothetical protein CIB84_005915 [Bambusicola thoracicus]|uniref:Glutathione S-transferase LANCL1 n=1 Tax=Bambusicola thoracicus TaxID=9083 RepID=A0A2P4T1U7_BAMTH|nr:hypothetical protein CIB84_005915 [Bambusicola thoracicus]
MMAQRALPNPYADYDKSLGTAYFDASGRLTPEFTQRLNNKIRELLQQMERGLKAADPQDCTAYTGWAGGLKRIYLGANSGAFEETGSEPSSGKSAGRPVPGIAVLYLHLHDVYGDPAYLHAAHEYVKKSLSCLTRRSITFLCGDAGPLAVAAVVYHKLQNHKQSEDCITR